MDDEITPDEVKDLLDADADVRIVDIRPEAQFRRGHIAGSESIPFHELPSRVEVLDDTERVVTVCPHGKASVQAAQLIGSYEGTADARVESMEGGLDKYGMKFGLVREEDDTDESANAESPF